MRKYRKWIIIIIFQIFENNFIFSLAFGSCLGGNGTLVGASCNLVAAGISEQHGYKISFMRFFKIGFPIMLSTVLASLIYVCITSTYLNWY